MVSDCKTKCAQAFACQKRGDEHEFGDFSSENVLSIPNAPTFSNGCYPSACDCIQSTYFAMTESLLKFSNGKTIIFTLLSNIWYGMCFYFA